MFTKIISPIDYLLNRITMYRLVLYVLIGILIASIILSFVGVLGFSPYSILISALILTIVSYITNSIFAYVYKVSPNVESVFITALILTLIINPINSFNDIVFIFWAGVLGISSKYILAINKKHIFNPAALAVVITGLGINQTASWWVGNGVLWPFVLAGGLLIVRKIKTYDLVFYFIAAVLILFMFMNISSGGSYITTINQLFFHSPLFFFTFIMLTEPMTTPPKKNLQVIYSILTAILFVPLLNLGNFYLAPEQALVIGNFFTYIVSPKYKLLLKLKDKIKVSDDIYDFIFTSDRKINYLPGQYMEWTITQRNSDSRGNRRYFTLASSPTEEDIRLGVKFYPDSSSFKKELHQINNSTIVLAGQLAGEFTLPIDKSKKLVFMAGGIGITPFRSMVKYLLDKKEKRDIVLLYSGKTKDEIVYRDIFEQAEKEIGFKAVYTLTDPNSIDNNWTGRSGRINKDLIINEVPDYKERFFYISGPFTMVTAFENLLKDLGVKSPYIKKDFFPGFV